MKFEEFSLDEKLLQGLDEAGYKECMPVQEQTLYHSLKKKDVGVQSQTGTGKTAAFLITVLQLHQSDRNEMKNTLVVVPTRELAVQIEQEALLLSKYLDVKIVSIFGGTGYKKQEALIEEGADILIGTPGRLIDFAKSGKLKLKDIGTLIIDEADRMFDMGFIPDLRWMIRRMPAREDRLTMLFSATLSSRVKQLAWEYMDDPVEIEIEPESITVEEIDQVLYHVSKDEKVKLLLGILKKENPETAIIFINTKQHAVELSKRLDYNGYKSSCLMGDVPQKKRLSIINRMKSGDIKLLVATDVAARGLHINDLEMVINYDLPEDCENYVHRIGRTARAGKSGKAVSLACEKYVLGLPSIEEYIKMKIPVEWADESMFEEDSSEGIRFKPERKGPSGRSGGRKGGSGNRRGTVSRGSGYAGEGRKRENYRKSQEKYHLREEKYSREEAPLNRDRKTASQASGSLGGSESRNDEMQKNSMSRGGRRRSSRDGRSMQNSRGKEGFSSRNSRQQERPRYNKKKGQSYEERIKYYNEKYGENISAAEEKSSSSEKGKAVKKKSFIAKLFGRK